MTISTFLRAALLSAVATLLPLIGVANAEMPVKGDGGSVRLLTSPFGTNSYPPFIMQKFGLDKKYGFKLELVPGLTTQARMVALRGGAADLTTVDWLEIARQRNNGLHLVGIAPFLRWGADFVVTGADTKLKTIGDIKGKKFGSTGRTSLNYVIVRAVAKNIYKFDLEKEAAVHEAAVPLLQGLLDKGEIEASEMFNSATPEMIVSGRSRVLVKISDLVNQLGLPDHPFLQYGAVKSFLDKSPQNARAFVAAYQEAVHILRTNDDVWLERGRDLKQSDAASENFRKEARTDIFDKYTSQTDGDIRKVFEVMYKEGGPEILGVAELPKEIITLEYQ